uniref:uncharacterized protein LOC122602975 n=1 Tax=Erigeron canadensis TaxID=72917 RepID=UPI001CB8B349|nr:uncharacterized protein LOC122602975 [Erigeron canadensis]
MKEFTVKGICDAIDETLVTNIHGVTRWSKLVPRKVNVLVWRILINRIPTRINLVNKGVDIPSSLCPLCGNSIETCNHIFGQCAVASRLWSLVTKWLQIAPIPLQGPTHIIIYIDDMHVSKDKKDIIEAIIYCVWWSIWKYRNEEVFNNGMNRKEFLFDLIFTQSYMWYSCRCKKKRISWVEWLNCPLFVP